MYNFPENQQVENDEYSMAANLIRYTSRSFYLTGKTGTGKTAFLEQAAKQSGKSYLFLSASNEAAYASGGSTIHSFFHLPYSPFMWESFTDNQKQVFHNFKKEKRVIIENAALIIIDDIASVRADTIDAIDFRLRNFGGKRNLPFGGKQVILAGDSFQLADLATAEEWELLKKNYDTPYFFSSRALLKADLLTIEFRRLTNNEDDFLSGLLNKIRRKQMLSQDVEQLNTRHVPDFSPQYQDNFVTLTPDKSSADNINRQKLAELNTPLHTYTGKLQGRFVREINDDLLPAPEVLELKENARVIFVKDDPAGRWYKGMVATVWALTKDSITVTINDGGIKLYQLETSTWHSYRYEADKSTGGIITALVGSFTQFPIRLGWAISVKKSKGLKFSNIIIDGFNEEAGSAYISLSRCAAFDGIRLKAPFNHAKLLVRDEVVRLSLAANNERLIKDAILNGQADQLYRNCVKAFNNGEFETAVSDLTKAISLRNDTLNPSFKRLMAIKLRGLKNVQQTALLQHQFPPLIREEIPAAVENSSTAEDQFPPLIQEEIPAALENSSTARDQPLTADPVLVQQLEDTSLQLEKIKEELASARQQLDTAMQELADSKQQSEATLSALQTGNYQNAAAVERLEATVSNISYQVAQQQEEVSRSREIITALNDTDADRDTDSKKAVKYWTNLNDQIMRLEVDIAKWKNILMIAGVVLCVVITVMLFVVFRY